MNEMIDRWLSVKEICTYLDVSNDTVYRWIKNTKCRFISLDIYSNSRSMRLMLGSRLVEQHLNQSNQESRRYKLTNIINLVRLVSENMIDGRSCSIPTMEKTTALNIVNVHALAYIAGERILAKSLFLPTSNKGAFPYIS